MSEKHTPLLLMHIPKTGGTSLNAYLESQYPKQLTALHIEEDVIGKPKEEFAHLQDKLFVSGHLKYPTLKDVVDVSKFFSMAVLRKPIDQTMSHLVMLKRIGQPKNKKHFDNFPDYIKRIIERILSVDIVEFIDTMNEPERNFFDNCQTRYMLPIMGDTPVTEEHAHQAIRTLGELDFVGLTERMDESLLLLAFYMGWKPAKKAPRKNISSREFFIDLETASDDVRDRFEMLTRHDNLLYEHAVNLFEKQVRRMVMVLNNKLGTPIELGEDLSLEHEQIRALLKKRASRGKRFGF